MPISCRRLAALALLGWLACAGAAAAAPQHTLAWFSGFESGFPGGEWFPWDNGSFSPNGAMLPGRVSAWTIVPSSSGEPVFSGDHAYRGWIVAPAGSSHRAYPGISSDDPNNIDEPIASPLVNSFMVWLDADFDAMSPSDWVHLGTWGNNVDWIVHTMSVRDGKLEMAHLSPFAGEYIGPQPRPDFPLRRWVRITVYIEYNGSVGFVQAWQDGVPMLRGAWTQRPGTALLRAHWGMYANGAVSEAVQYNDDIAIWTLDEPLTDLVSEPLPTTVPEPAAAAAALAALGALAAVRARSRA
ncbi:MAG: hypothetical protein DCC71_05135 [Proteobacteria bacterium]|nr:MAG: hypothetical protein DCC71_05135 [Pseudomonadota bacterium]